MIQWLVVGGDIEWVVVAMRGRLVFFAWRRETHTEKERKRCLMEEKKKRNYK